MISSQLIPKTKLFGMISLLLIATLISGCTSVAKGITEAVMSTQNNRGDTRKCYVRGRPFEGLEAKLKKQEEVVRINKNDRPVLKVLVVHGIGSHQPGYSTRLAENLVQTLSLNRVQETIKEITITHPEYPFQELGLLRLTRYMNADESREVIFAELTWEPIIEKEKKTINFDNSGEYSFRRAPINNMLKVFVNNTIPDVMMFNGTSRQKIQISVGQSLCWLIGESWETLKSRTAQYCDASAPSSTSRIHDDFVFITHSLGSRITVDALQSIASAISNFTKADAGEPPQEKHNHSTLTNLPTRNTVLKHKHYLQQKEFTIFMLSNQLPLLQLGQPKPEITGQIAEICNPEAPQQNEKIFHKTHLIAFSDPNDLLSYALPPTFIHDYVDSRLCPTLTNVILNVSDITDIFVGEFANPLSAHTDYDNDSRVIDLIARGIGHGEEDPHIAEDCTWLESVPDRH